VVPVNKKKIIRSFSTPLTTATAKQQHQMGDSSPHRHASFQAAVRSYLFLS
jgi:hypothetical protein